MKAVLLFVIWRFFVHTQFCIVEVFVCKNAIPGVSLFILHLFVLLISSKRLVVLVEVPKVDVTLLDLAVDQLRSMDNFKDWPLVFMPFCCCWGRTEMMILVMDKSCTSCETLWTWGVFSISIGARGFFFHQRVWVKLHQLSDFLLVEKSQAPRDKMICILNACRVADISMLQKMRPICFRNDQEPSQTLCHSFRKTTWQRKVFLVLTFLGSCVQEGAFQDGPLDLFTEWFKFPTKNTTRHAVCRVFFGFYPLLACWDQRCAEEIYRWKFRSQKCVAFDNWSVQDEGFAPKEPTTNQHQKYPFFQHNSNESKHSTACDCH